MWKTLRELREAKGLSRADVGKALGVKEASVWRWEHPRECGGCAPDIERLPDILDLYMASDDVRAFIAQELRITRPHSTSVAETPNAVPVIPARRRARAAA
jgi:transcriptional regulator with XRE-family HTH domain